MTNTEKFQTWARHGHWSNWERKPDRTEDLRQLIVSTLCEAAVPLSTTQLVDAILPGIDYVGRIYVSGGIQYLRKHGKLNGFWSRGKPNGRTFGHASIIWGIIEPADGAAGLEDVL